MQNNTQIIKLNSMKTKLIILWVISFAQNLIAQNYKANSPDNLLEIEIIIEESIKWNLLSNGELIAGPSTISMTLEKQGNIGSKPVVKRISRLNVNETLKTPVYKKSEVVNAYNQLNIEFKNGFGLIFRVFNDGVAYRLNTSFKNEITVLDEEANFVFPTAEKSWVPYIVSNLERYMTSFESTYDILKLNDIDINRLIITPLLVDAGKGRKIVITEADLEDYAGMFVTVNKNRDGFKGQFAPYPLEEKKGGHNNLQSIVTKRAGYIAKTIGTRSFPWRVFVVSQNDKDLLDNDMIAKLASPNRIGDLTWIKPGKVAWDWWNDLNITGVDFKSGVNNETYKYYIDFASKHGIEYVILDEGWSEQSSLLNIKPHINLKGIVDHAKTKGVKIILWGGWLPLDAEIEKVMEVYSKMGIAGFKVDFMDRDDQKTVNFYYRLAKKAAEYKMLIDFHGSFKPTGLQHTYPNVITFEGVYGLENVKWTQFTDFPGYDVTIPFIRAIAGPMDYTPGAMINSNRWNWRAIHSTPMSQGTRCHQLAMYVIYESPLSMMADNPTHYMRESDCTQFIASVPTVFDQTVALNGKLSEYVTIARRKGKNWYVGSMTNWDQREIELELSFLGDGTYEAEIFSDGINADRNASDYKKVSLKVTKNSILKLNMASGGGWVATFKPL